MTVRHDVTVSCDQTDSPADMSNNCAFWGTSVKLGTYVEFDLLKIFGYRPKKYFFKMAAKNSKWPPKY